ncbi:unnamed protein product [Coregonus sp. 'balchen']|nr:unnamed protein product [Coregonus sp. 'balchen']
MVTTERDYVRSLRYIIEHYFPEMERGDLPQDLRGKRSVIFGNLEKLMDFHSQYFLKGQDAFGLYALYSKNKPRSDTLLASHGNSFFRNKQLELGDKMDLASYLLKPIQRMSKYALLLKDLIKEVSEAQETELAYLQAAAEMVKFQLRHGNDLLAMDAIRDCDTADVGMTEMSGDNGLRFEVWFRRRTSKNQTYVLQASNTDIKHAWTSNIARILWQQATRNKATESSGSSSHCLSASGSSGSDSGCVSSHLPEACLSEDPSFPCHPPSSCYPSSDAVTSPSLPQDEPRYSNRQYISAV